MPTFEVEIDEYDLESAGYIHEDEIDYSKAIEAINDYYFKNNLTKDQTYKDIVDILESL